MECYKCKVKEKKRGHFKSLLIVSCNQPSTKVVTSAGNWQYQSNPSPSLPAGSTSKRQSFQADNNNNNNVFKNANLPAASTITNTRQSFDGSLSSQQQPQLSAAAEVNNAQQSSSLKKTNSYIISSSSNNEDILSKLRFTEEQLIQERRSRSWLESEIQSGKNLVATLTAKVEKLNDSFTVESLTVRELQRQLDMSSTVAKEGTKDLSSKLEKDNLKLQQMFSEVAARQRHYEKNTEDYEIKNRALMEELNQMRYKVESFALKASETNNEVKAATHELDIEHQRSSEAFRVLQDQGHAIEVLHNNVETKSETIKRTVDMTVYETRQRLDAESRNRSLFEQNTKDFISEQRKVMMSQERALAERIDSTRRGILQIVDLEKQDREKSVAVAIEQIRNWEKTMKESEAQLMSRIMQHYTSLESGMTEERTLRTKFEIAIRADVEDAFRMLKDLIAQKSTETMDSHMDLKQKVVNAVKVLQDSMTLTEKTLQARVSTIEEVLRAEIKSRMDAESKVEAAFADNMQVVSSLEGNIMGQVDLIAQELRESDASVLKELGDTKEQLSASKSRSIVDLETQIKQVHQRIKEDEKEAMEKSKMLQTHLQKLSADYQAAIENAVEQLNVRIVAAKVDTEELRVLIRGTNDTVQANKTAIEEKVSMRAVQLDQALEAFKEDLRLKMAIVDGESMEANLKSMLAGLSSSVSEMGKTLTDTKDSIETRATKNDLDDTEAKLKLSISTVAEKTSEMSEALNATKEQFALYSLIPDVDQIKANLKASISQLEARDMQIEELLISQRSELSERVLKSQVNETEDRLRKLLNELETGQSQLQESIDLLKGDFGNKISMNSLKDLEKKLVTEIDAATSQIRFNIEEIKSQHRETKLKLKESIDGINSQLANTTVKAEGAMNGVETIKSKLNETDTNIKTKLKEAMHAHEAVMTDQLLLLETIKEATQEQLYELASKIEDIPNTLRYSELQYSDFRRQITESTLKEQQKFSTLLGELQDLISKKVSSEDFESLQSDIKSNYQRVASQLDIERVIIEQLKERIHEVEGQARERIKEILTVQERGLGDQENSSKVWRDAAFKRLEELDTRLKHYPKLFETTFGDIKQIRTDVDSKVNHDLHNLEKEIKSLKSDVSKVRDYSRRGVKSYIFTHLLTLLPLGIWNRHNGLCNKCCGSTSFKN